MNRKKAAFGAALLMLPMAAHAEGVQTGMSVDLTEVVIAVMMLLFELLLAWAARCVLPALRAWLTERTSEGQRQRLYELTRSLVSAAEQVMGRGKGSEKLRYVMEGLEKRGMTADIDLIEAAVREMNDRTLQAAGYALGMTDAQANEN